MVHPISACILDDNNKKVVDELGGGLQKSWRQLCSENKRKGLILWNFWYHS